MLELRRLRLLRELEARGTVTAVARALMYSPSSVSEQLAELEREAGVPLFERTGRNLRLTEAGRVLAEHARDLLLRMEEAEAAVAAAAGAVTGIVRVASVQSAAIEVLPGALRRVAATHPSLRVEVAEMETEPALEALVLHELDLLVAVEYDHQPRPRHASLEREDLLHEPMRVVLPADHPADEEGPVRLADLRDASWAAGNVGTGHAAMLVRACNALGGFEPNIRHRADDLLVLRALVQAGGAVTLLPELVVDATVRAHAIAEGNVGRTLFLAVRSGALAHPALLAVRDALRAACGSADG